MLSDGTFEINLVRPIEVAGVQGEVTSLTFHECGTGYDNYYLKLRKFVISSQMKSISMLKDLHDVLKNESKNEDDDKLKSGEELKPIHLTPDDEHENRVKETSALLKMSLGTSDDMENIVKVFNNMVGRISDTPICTRDGVQVKEGAWNRLHPEDKINATVKYCAFFGIGLDKQHSNEQETVSTLPTEVKVL